MARTVWQNRSWLRRFAWHRKSAAVRSIPLDHGLFPGNYFQEKLRQERNRALRSHKPLVVMVLHAENLRLPGEPGGITKALGKAVHTCVRESDICGLLKEDLLVGVILTEVEAEKVPAAQLTVARKTREKLGRELSRELAERVEITFHIFPADGVNRLFGQAPEPDLIATKEQS